MGHYTENALERFFNRLTPKAKKPARPITCRFCQATDLRWKTIPGGRETWGLYTKNGEPHNCRIFPTHRLKSWSEFFNEIIAGHKTHDLRRSSDRKFEVGQHIMLCEFDPQIEKYTGREQLVRITYMTSSDVPCALSNGVLHPDFTILSIALA